MIGMELDDIIVQYFTMSSFANNTQHNTTPLRRFKVIVAGDGGVGKTSLLTRHSTGHFKTTYVPTLGCDVVPLKFQTNLGEVTLDVWDTAGQEKFMGLQDGYFIGAHAAIIMFDVQSMSSFKNIEKWNDDIVRVAGNIPTVLCGNKVECSSRKVTPVDIHEHVHADRPFYYISCKSNYNFEKPFLHLVRQLLDEPDLEFTNYVLSPTVHPVSA